MTSFWVGILVAVLAASGIVIAVMLVRRRSGAVPWFLVVGPTDVWSRAWTDALHDALPQRRRARIGWPYISRQLGLSVWGTSKGTVIHVAEGQVPSQRDVDIARWRRLLQLLRRYRRRRPIDGVILAVPAPILLDSESRPDELGAGLRERLAEIQRHLGFVLPVYVVVTESDAIRGFGAFAGALPEHLRASMLGWSNGHATAAVSDAVAGDLTALRKLVFSTAWVDEGLATLERAVVPAQVEVLASAAEVTDPAGLILFSGEVARLGGPLKEVLREVFRPNLYVEPCFLRGVYFSGAGAFLEDLLGQKVFGEAGLAIPSPEVAVSRLRGRLAAQVVCAVLAVGLGVGTAWSYLRLREMQPAYARVLMMGDALLGSPLATTTRERLNARRRFLEQAQAIKRGLATEILTRTFIPASVPTERRLSGVVGGVFDGLLGDARVGLEGKWPEVLGEAAVQVGESQGPLGPKLEETAPYKALDRFADRYQQFADSFERYLRLRRAETAGDLTATSDLLEYLVGSGITKTPLAPSFTRALRATRAPLFRCEVFVRARTGASLVAERGSELLKHFGSLSFDDLVDEESPEGKNVLAAASRFKEDWASISDGDAVVETLGDLAGDTTTFAEAVAAWAALRGPSAALAVPVFDKPPFRQRSATDGFCDALRPDLSTEVEAVEALKDQLTPRLLADDVEPFGPLLEEGDSGLGFSSGVTALKRALDDLQRQDFWQQLPTDPNGTLPRNPTWRKEDVDGAVRIADAFDAYSAGAFRGVDAAGNSYRRALLDLVESGVAQAVSARLVSTAGMGRAGTTRSEEATRLGAQLESMARLTTWLSSEPVGLRILNALDTQAGLALDAIDLEASRGYFFSARRNSPTTSADVFAAWRDVGGTASAADAIKLWAAVVDEQRESVRRLATEARPIVHYLADRRPSDRQRRWTGIIAEVADSEQKRPENGLNALESAMREGVPSMVPEKSCGPAGSSGPLRRTSVFEVVRKDLLDEGVRQCLEVRYAAVAEAFTRLLANRFPFSARLDGGPEATREQTAQFLRVYERQGGLFLHAPLVARSCSQDASTFVQRMDRAYALLASVVPAPPGSRGTAAPEIALDVVPDFRVAQALDNGGSQVSEWQMDIGGQTFRERGAPAPLTQVLGGTPPKPVTWTSGDPITLTARFARDSPNRPIPGSNTAASAGALVSIEDRTVRWRFDGDWAIIRLLRSGPATPDVRRLSAAAPAIAAFDIPVERDPTRPPLVGEGPQSPFKVYLRLKVSPTGKTDVLQVDEFPFEAPPSASCPGV